MNENNVSASRIGHTPRLASLAILSLLMASLVTGCDPGPTPPQASAAAPAVEPDTTSSRDFGEYVVYFNALRTDALTPEIAKMNNIARSANRALVNISLVKKAEGTAGAPVNFAVQLALGAQTSTTNPLSNPLFDPDGVGTTSTLFPTVSLGSGLPGQYGKVLTLR